MVELNYNRGESPRYAKIPVATFGFLLPEGTVDKLFTIVTTAKAGVQKALGRLDSGLRRNDEFRLNSRKSTDP